MAWTDAVLYTGPNVECHDLTAGAAGDTTVTVPHSLGNLPIVVTFTPLNAAAASAGFWASAFTTTSIDISKPNGAPGAQIRIHLSTLRHPH